MKKYQSHKIVEAARITAVSQEPLPHKNNPLGRRELALDDGNIVHGHGAQFDKAEAGGYYVVYDGGSYASYSPAKAFEEGYTEVGNSPTLYEFRKFSDLRNILPALLKSSNDKRVTWSFIPPHEPDMSDPLGELGRIGYVEALTTAGVPDATGALLASRADAFVGVTIDKTKAPTGPRVTLEDIHEAIASEHYFTGLDGVVGARGACSDYDIKSLAQITYCVLILKNGHRIVGVNEGPVSAENFDANLGRKYAYEDAIEACWPLLGFALKDRLYRREQSLAKIGDDVKRMADANESMIGSLSNISIVDSSVAGTFGYALAFLKRGAKIARAGWNGKGMFAYLVPANTYPAQTGAAKSFFGATGMVPYNAYMVLKGADNTVSTWAPSGSDALAEDWVIVPD